MPFVILACVGFGLLCLWIAGRQRKAVDLPVGRVIIADDLGPGRRGPVLYDPGVDLAGRPDYVIEHRDDVIPVEVKSRRAPHDPYPSHVLQLAAYCRLVEAAYGRRPAYGVLEYRDRSFSIDYTAELEDELQNVLEQMRLCEDHAPDRSHASIRRCASCGFRQMCDQALA
jgi:CRISPR-associated exonuclease Cas4